MKSTASTRERACCIPEYYDNPRWNEWFTAHGVDEVSEGLHDNFPHSAIMMFVDPVTGRMPQRVAVGLFSINGVDLTPGDETVAPADRLIEYQARVTVAAIRHAIEQQREPL